MMPDPCVIERWTIEGAAPDDRALINVAGPMIPPHAQRRVVLESDYDALAADHRGAIADVQRLQSSLEILAERIERDRREPDKVLCYVLDMRRAAAPRGQ